MSKLSPELGKFFAKTIQALTLQPGEKMTTNRAEAVLKENQHSEVTVRGFTLIQDEPVSVMGGGKGPTPTDFFISSVALCENVIFARNAALNGLPIDSLETVASGTWDLKGLWEIDGADSSFRSITVETKLRTSGPASEAARVAALTHRRCPIYATLRKSVNLVQARRKRRGRFSLNRSASEVSRRWCDYSWEESNTRTASSTS